LWRPEATAYITGWSWMHPWPWRPPSLYRSSKLRPPRRASQGQIFVRGIRSGSHASPPDMDLLLENGSRTALYRFLEDGRWVRLQRAPDKDTLSNAEWITSVNLAPEGNDRLLANFASVLVRPDGYLAHVRPAEGGRNAEKASDPPALSSVAASGDPKMLRN